MSMTAEQLARYRKTTATRIAEEARKTDRRRELAWHIARDAAAILKDRFGVRRVCAFGSVLREESFTLWSDLDIAAWGLTPKNWLKASATVRMLSDEIEVNLVDIDTCTQPFLEEIERDGIPL